MKSQRLSLHWCVAVFCLWILKNVSFTFVFSSPPPHTHTLGSGGSVVELCAAKLHSLAVGGSSLAQARDFSTDRAVTVPHWARGGCVACGVWRPRKHAEIDYRELTGDNEFSLWSGRGWLTTIHANMLVFRSPFNVFFSYIFLLVLLLLSPTNVYIHFFTNNSSTFFHSLLYSLPSLLRNTHSPVFHFPLQMFSFILQLFLTPLFISSLLLSSSRLARADVTQTSEQTDGQTSRNKWKTKSEK